MTMQLARCCETALSFGASRFRRWIVRSILVAEGRFRALSQLTGIVNGAFVGVRVAVWCRGELELQSQWLRMAGFIVSWKEKIEAQAPDEELKPYQAVASSLHFAIRGKEADPLLGFWKRYQTGEDLVQSAIEAGNGYALKLADRYVEYLSPDKQDQQALDNVEVACDCSSQG